MSATLRQQLLPILAGVGLYLVTTGVSYAAFGYLRTPPDLEYSTPLPEGGMLAIDPSEPRTEPCPMTGTLYTETERKAWEGRRPLAVMIENHSEARPQSGLSKADIVYEAVAEGGITRFLAIYLCDAIAQDTLLGPIRSARTYYLDWASEYGATPLYVHVGGANLPGPANALGQIQEYGWGGRNGNDLNQFSIGYPTFWRDYDRLGRTVATEHTMYSTTEKLWQVGKDRGWTSKDPDTMIDWQELYTPWTFSEEAETGTGVAEEIDFGFWEGYEDYGVIWRYDPETRLYERINGGSPLKDLNNDSKLTAKVIIVQLTDERGPIDELKHMIYRTIGTGKALIFQDGKVLEATWRKSDRTTRTVYTSSKTGREVVYLPGKIWIEIVPTGNSVDFK